MKNIPTERKIFNGIEQEVLHKLVKSSFISNLNFKKLNINGLADDQIVKLLSRIELLKNNETLFIKSGQPLDVLQTNETAPRLIIVDSFLIQNSTDWDEFRKLENTNTTISANNSIGNWLTESNYSIISENVCTLSLCAKKYFSNSIAGRILVSSGLGNKGFALPIAAKLLGASSLISEVSESKINVCIESGFIDYKVNSIAEAIELLDNSKLKSEPISVAVLGNAAEVLAGLVSKKFLPDIVTDQTPSHDLLYGYIPMGLRLDEADLLRKANPKKYLQLSQFTIVSHMKSLLELKKMGSVTFEFGNDIREKAKINGVSNAFSFNGFVNEFYLDRYIKGQSYIQIVCSSGITSEIDLILNMFNKPTLEKECYNKVTELFESNNNFGLPSWGFLLGMEEQLELVTNINSLIMNNKILAPVIIVIGKFSASMGTSRFNESENFPNNNNIIADWPLLAALFSTSVTADTIILSQGKNTGLGKAVVTNTLSILNGTKNSLEKVKKMIVGISKLDKLRLK